MAEKEVTRFLQLNQPAMLAILGHCIITPSFLRNCAKCLTKTHIEDVMISNMYQIVLNYYNKYQKGPTRSEVEATLAQEHSDFNTLNKYRGLLGQAIDLQAQNFRVEALQADISAWLKTLVMRDILKRGGDLFNRENYNAVEKLIFDMQSMLKDASFDHDERVDMSDMGSIINSVVVNRNKACTLGHPDFDELIMNGAKIHPSDPKYDETKIQGVTKGCLLPGEITILMGPINSGKTTTISTIAVSNVMMGKKVCLVGCEDPKDKMTLKMFQTFCQKPMNELSRTASDGFLESESAWNAISSENLHYFEWIKPGKMFVEDIIDLVENAQEKAIAKDGRGFDLLIVDYPGVLDSNQSRAKDVWDVKRYIYNQLKLVGVKNKFHVFAPIQTNREGFKLNASAERLLDMGDVAQGFGIVADADNVITINRSMDDHASMRVKFYIAKTRSGEAKRAFVSEVRYDLGRTHGLGYGFSTYEAKDIKDLADDQIVTQRLKRIKTAEISQLRNPGGVAYDIAPPLDKAAERDILAQTVSHMPLTQMTAGEVKTPNSGGFNGAVDPDDIPEHLRNK